MADFGFIKVAAAVPQVKVADCIYNTEHIISQIKIAESKGVEIIVFPELAVTAYSCGDLFHQAKLLESAQESLSQLLGETSDLNITVILGMPLNSGNQLIDAAVVFGQGEIYGVVPKHYLTNKRESNETRWFTPAWQLNDDTITVCGQEVPMGADLIFRQNSYNQSAANGSAKITFGVEISSDLWATIPQSSYHTQNGAQIIFNTAANTEEIGKYEYIKNLIANQSARCLSGYVYASAGFGESSTDSVFAGNAVIAENGKILAESPRFTMEEQLIISDIDIEYLDHDRMVNGFYNNLSEREYRIVKIGNDINEESDSSIGRVYDALPFVPKGEEMDKECEEIFNIQVAGLAKRMVHTNCKNAVIGISGGLDSTLALLVAVQTFDALKIPRSGIVAVTMPGFGTTDRTYNNAVDLINSLGVTFREIPIKEACIQHFKDIGHDVTNHNVVYENAQARERTQILMDISNQINGMVIGTGDFSELALGWATYNGDHMSMYGVNADIPKTLVKYLVSWVAKYRSDEHTGKTLLDIVDTPISPELIPADEKGNIKQKTEDLVGPYELHDFFLYHLLRHGASPEKIYFLAKGSFAGVYDDITIKKWLTTCIRRFFNMQFKRSCLPDGPKVGSVGLSPRGEWQMPSDACSRVWMEELEML
ncbi:MAG: NAD(+) synthase [Bacteroidales bacterium]|nr:NAD(+) synthase [Bacteroidales bacterium]